MKSDKSLGFFQSPLFLSSTVGVPFCIYKLLLGILILRVGNFFDLVIPAIVGYIVILWACLDFIMNMKRVEDSFFGRESTMEYCILAQAGRLFRAPRFFLAIDTAFSFSIICFILWSGWIAHMEQPESWLWSMATTVNLLSIALVNLAMEFESLHKKPERKSL